LNLSNHPENSTGQALVELTVVLPLLLLYAAVLAPLLLNSMYVPWLDERLALTQLKQNDDRIHDQLLFTHSSDRLPSYFEKSRIDESSRVSSPDFPIPVLSEIFPGVMVSHSVTVTLPDGEWWNSKILGDPKERNVQISRNMSMLASTILNESTAFKAVKRLAFPGIVTDKAAFLEKTGVDLFHLDLDALPQSGEGG
jgi:hypothetical protein